MWFIQPKQDYVAQMPWKHTDEPAVMAWQIRARDYHTFVANCGFFAWLIAGLSFISFLIYEGGYNITDEMNLVLIGVFALSIPIAMSMFFQTTIIVYRLTDKRIEVFSWKPQIDSVKPVMKWTAILSGIAVVIASIINPSFIIAGIGPIGIGVMAALMGTSKNYQSMARNQMEYEINWLEAQRIYAYRSRNIIGLNIHWFNPDIGETITKSIQPVFVTGDMFDDVLDFLKGSFRQSLLRILNLLYITRKEALG